MLRSSLLALRSPAFKAAQQTPLRRLAVGPSARVGALAEAFATTRPARQDELDLYSSPYDSFGSQVAVQRPAPFFKGVAAVDGAFQDVSLTDYKGKWLVLLFYPLDFTFVCPTEILAFDRALPAFRELNTEVLAVSTDSEFSHLAWANMPRAEGGLGPDLKIPLFSDKNHQMSTDYGVLLPKEGISLRGLFLIDPQGVTRQITINDLPVGRSVEETIRLVKAFQFVEKHGEVCPADWSPENPATIKPSPSESKSYFAQAAEKVKEAL